MPGEHIILGKGYLLALASKLQLWDHTFWVKILVNGESLLDGVLSQEAILGCFFKVSLTTLVFPYNGLGILIVDVVFLGDLINTEKSLFHSELDQDLFCLIVDFLVPSFLNLLGFLICFLVLLTV